MKKIPNGDTVQKVLAVVADLLQGNRHSRRTVAAATGRSLPTADRWIEHIAMTVPNVRRVREGKTTWLLYDGRREIPTNAVAVGACVAASLASVFEGSQHERNLKDARDYLLRLRGESYGDLDRKLFFAPKGGEYALPEAREALDVIVGAVLDGMRIRFSYRHNDGRVERVDARPLTLVIFDHQFYLLVRRDDDSLYCHRFARMSDVEASGDSFPYPSKNEYDPRRLFASVFGIHVSDKGQVEDVEVILRGPWASYAATHRWHPTQQTSKLAGGRVAVQLRVRLCPEIETWVLGFGENAVVVKPDLLRMAVAERLARAAQIYFGKRPPIAKAKRVARPTSRDHRAR